MENPSSDALRELAHTLSSRPFSAPPKPDSIQHPLLLRDPFADATFRRLADKRLNPRLASLNDGLGSTVMEETFVDDFTGLNAQSGSAASQFLHEDVTATQGDTDRANTQQQPQVGNESSPSFQPPSRQSDGEGLSALNPNQQRLSEQAATMYNAPQSVGATAPSSSATMIGFPGAHFHTNPGDYSVPGPAYQNLSYGGAVDGPVAYQQHQPHAVSHMQGVHPPPNNMHGNMSMYMGGNSQAIPQMYGYPFAQAPGFNQNAPQMFYSQQQVTNGPQVPQTATLVASGASVPHTAVAGGPLLSQPLYHQQQPQHLFHAPPVAGVGGRVPIASAGGPGIQYVGGSGTMPAGPHRHQLAVGHRDGVGKPRGPVRSGVQSAGSQRRENRGVLNDEQKQMLRNDWLTLGDILGSLGQYARDQFGSRFIQQQIEVADDTVKASAFVELLPAATSLATDVFGNYVVQKLIEHGSGDQLLEIGKALQGDVLSLSLQMYGCRVIQKALECMPAGFQHSIAVELKGHIMECVLDQNGNHVVQKCIEMLPAEENVFILEALQDEVRRLSLHPYGCRVVQRVLEHCSMERRCFVLDEAVTDMDSLIRDQYGNYVAQHVLRFGEQRHKDCVVDCVQNNLLAYSQHKFASNVVERCLQVSSDFQRKDLITVALEPTSEGAQAPLDVMMKDQYANFVVQRIMEISEGQQRDRIFEKLQSAASYLKKFTYGKHILSKLETLRSSERDGRKSAKDKRVQRRSDKR